MRTNMKALGLFSFLLATTIVAGSKIAAQSMGPLSGAEPKSFSLSPDNAGFLENSVNIFNGQVQFPFPLMSLHGKGATLSYSASLFYNSNVNDIATIRNQEAPTGPFGLGWSMDRPRIIADHKGTGTRHDDDFYLQEGGASNELIPNGTSGSLWLYKTKKYQPWKISYDPAAEEWIVQREDGTKYKYGTSASTQKTVQYMIRWNNWIGSSSLQTGQAQMAYIWDLSEIEDTWGDKLLFTYEHEEEHVSNGTVPGTSIKHTRASYLKQVANLAGRKLVFTLAVKGGLEFSDPHTETAEPDPYQEKFETKYVSKVGLYSEQNQLLQELELGYGLMGSGDLTKRLLTSVNRKDGSGATLSGADYGFQYITNAGATYNTGAMSTVTLPTNGTVSFNYTNLELAATELSYTLAADNAYKEPRIFIGGDYVVITRRNVPGGTHSDAGQTVIVDVLTWDGGKWHAQRLTSMQSVNMVTAADGVKEQNFQLVMGKDFFATLNKRSNATTYDLNLYKRKANEIADWHHTAYSFDNTISTSGLGASPTLMAGEDFILVGTRENRHIHYDWLGSQWYETSVGKTAGSNYFYAAANNFFVTHNVNGSPDDIRLYYKDRTNTWKYGTFNPHSVNAELQSGIPYWHATNGFAALMTPGHTEYIYGWDINYANTANGGALTNMVSYSTGYSGLDHGPVVWINNSMVAMLKNTDGRAFRFNGSTFTSTSFTYYHNSSIDERYKYSFSDDNVLHLYSSTQVGRRYYNPMSGAWVTGSYYATSSSNYQPRNIIAGGDYMAIGNKVYFRNPDGSYTTDPLVIPGDDLQLFLVTLHQGGLDFIVSGGIPATTGYNFKNGAVLAGLQNLSGYIIDAKGAQNHRPSNQVGYNTVVTYSGSGNHVDATSLILYRKINEQYSGKIKKWVATSITSSDGTNNLYTSYAYADTTATVDPSGAVPQFSVIKTVPGSASAATTPHGYTLSYFFNGLPAAQVGNNFPALGGNTGTHYQKMTGIPYRTQIFNSAGSQLSESVQDYYGDYVVGDEFRVRAFATSSTTDGITTGTTFAYNSIGQLASQTTTNASETVVVSTTYWWEQYDPARTTGLTAPVIAQTKTVNGQVVEATATKWKNWSGSTKPAPWVSFSWDRTGSSTFTHWSTSHPTSGWKLQNEVLSYDLARGLPIETVGPDGMRSYQIYDPNRPLPLATCTGYSAAGTVKYEGFENATSNTSATAKAGTKSRNTSYSITGVSGTATLTYWKKVGSGNWEYVQTAAANTTIGAAGTLLDEIKIFPEGSYMTSYSYDALGNVLTSNDPNNILSYYEYDSFGRLKLVRDHQNNILKTYSYKFKN